MKLALAAIAILSGASLRAGEFKVTPADLAGADGVPDAVDVDSHYYKARFLLSETGSAQSLVYKPLNHELRAEDYYANRNNLFRDWVRLAEPDPVTGLTRRVGKLELQTQSRLPATWKVVRQDDKELVLEFEVKSSTEGGQPWMEKVLNRRRIFLRNDSPAIRVENEIVNTDGEARSVLFDVFNSVGLGRVQTAVAMPSPEGKVAGVDIAEERGSSFLFAPELADAWIGGVNEKGLGAAFSFAWPDVDAMQVCMWKTVGASYHAVMRRRDIPAGKSIVFRYTFMPFTGFGAFDGMNGDLAGGFLVGGKADYVQDVAEAELKPGATVPIKVFLASGRDRQANVRLRCVRVEDKKVVLDEAKPLALKVGQTATLASKAALAEDGLYVFTVTAEGDGASLKMERAAEVGKTKLFYAATPPAGEKLGKRDGGEGFGPPSLDPQFRTLDLKFTTPHLPLLRNHAKGPVKAFFLVPADGTLGHVREIVQRADIAPDYSAITKVRLPRDELHEGDLAEFRKKLRAAEPQALVTLGIQWHVGLKRKLIKELLDRVGEGMGAVIEVRNLKEEPELAAALAEGKELAELPSPAVAVAVPAVRRFALGKGRVALVVCNWNSSRDAADAALGDWTTLRLLRDTTKVEELRWRGFEYSYALLADLVRWAAGQDASVVVTDAALKGDVVSVSVHNAGEQLAARLHVTVRSRRWTARTEGEMRVELPPGDSSHLLTLGKAPDGGPLALEAHVRAGDGKTLAFGSAGASAYEVVKMKVIPQPGPFQSAAQPGACAVELEGTVPGGRLEVAVVDRFGRVVDRSRHDVKLANGKGTAAFLLQGVKARSVYHEVAAEFYSADAPPRLLAEASADVFLLPPKAPYADAFMLGVWGAPERRAMMLQAMLGTTHDLGLTLHSHSYDDRVLYATGGFKTANITLSPKDRYARPGEKPAMDSEKLVMTPPLLPSAEAVEAVKAEWQKKAREQYESGARLIGLDDERRMSDDFDFSPQTLAGFREWLAKRYADVAELNRAWGTQFAGFAQVVPKRRKELGDSPNLAPWLEFRMFIGEVLGDWYMKAPADWAAEIAPDLSVGEWGIYEPSVNWPVDWSRYARCYKFTARYGGTQGVLEELFRSFAPGTRHGQWMGYGMRAIGPGRRIAPWQSLLNGGSFCWFWEMRDSGFLNYAVVTSDQRPTAGYAALAKEEVPDLTGGIDRLILASQSVHDPIAIGYSYPSWLADGAALARDAKVIIEELGFQHLFVTMDDVAAGRLEKDGFRLLVIQQASCLSKEQVEGVRRFAEAGGIVLCIGRAGWRDLHGAPHADGCLMDALTGVDTSQAAALGRTLATPPSQPALCLAVADGGVVAKDATVLASVAFDDKELPVWTVRDQAKGKVYWLNASLGAHRAVRTGGVAGELSVALGGPEAVRKSHWDVFDHAVAMAGVKPRCRLFKDGQPVFDAETWYYETPSKRTLLVAHHLSRKVEGAVNVRFDRKAHVYELRAHRYFGETDVIQDSFPEGTMRIYALTGARMQKPAAKADDAKCDPGTVVRVNCHMLTYGKDVELDVVPYRLRAFDASGRELPAYERVVLAPGGRHVFEVPLALDHPPGRQSVVITDAFTGQDVRVYFIVSKTEEKKR